MKCTQCMFEHPDVDVMSIHDHAYHQGHERTHELLRTCFNLLTDLGATDQEATDIMRSMNDNQQPRTGAE